LNSWDYPSDVHHAIFGSVHRELSCVVSTTLEVFAGNSYTYSSCFRTMELFNMADEGATLTDDDYVIIRSSFYYGRCTTIEAESR